MAKPTQLKHVALHLRTLTLAKAPAQRGMSPGVLLFAKNLQLLYANKEALQFNQRLLQMFPGHTGRAPLAPLLRSICEEVIELLHVSSDPKDAKTQQVERVVDVPPIPLLLRGMGIPASQSILVLVEPLTEQ